MDPAVSVPAKLQVKATADVVLSMFVYSLKRESAGSAEKLHQQAYKLLQAYIEELGECSNVIFIPELATKVISTQNFDELRTADPHVIHLYVYTTVKTYLSELQRTKRIQVTHPEQFINYTRSIGINFPEVQRQHESTRQSLQTRQRVGSVMAWMTAAFMLFALVSRRTA
jgi:hypothetical protein